MAKKEGLSARDKTLAFCSFVMLTGGIVFFTWYSFKSHSVDTLSGASPFSLAAKPAFQTDSQRFERAKELRKQWEPWARKHKALLVQASKADNQDSDALTRLYSELPAKPKEAGIKNINDPSGRFTWQPFVKSRVLGNGKYPSEANNRRIQNSMKSLQTKLKGDFALYRDVVISSSINPGMKRVSLWASGRITETSYKEQYIPGKPVFVEEQPVELVAPFSFISQ